MKKSRASILYGILMLFLALPAWGGMRIVDVTLYPNSAEVVKEGKINVVKGQTRVELCTIPRDAKNGYKVTLYSTKVSLVGYEAVPIKNDEEIEALERDILVLKTERKAIELRIKLIEKMIEFMGTSPKKEKPLHLIPVSKVMEREGRLEQWLTRSKVREREITKEIKDKQEKLNALKNQKGFKVFAHVKGKGKGIIKVSYVTRKAWWRPMYKAVLSRSGGISFSMLAKCGQRTGENWQGVELRFSTTTPGGRLYPPEPSPIWVRPVEPLREEAIYRGRKAKTLMAAPVPAMAEAQYQEKEVGGTYNLKGFASLPSGSERRFCLGKWNLKTLETLRKSYPSVDQGVYLQVSASLPPVPLPKGPVKLYQDDVESGQVPLSKVLKGDHLLLSFGKDRLVTVKRELVYRYLDEKFGNKVEVTNRYKITVTNSRSRLVRVSVTEPFPISQDERIKVSFCQGYPSPIPTNVNREKGFYTWTFGIAPGKSKTIEYCYKVKYPRDLELNHRF